MVSLPDCIRPGRLSAMHEVKGIAIDFAALVSESDKPGGQASNDIADHPIAWLWLFDDRGKLTYLAIDRLKRQWRSLKRESFNSTSDSRRNSPPPAPVLSPSADKSH
jgi:hypothetical protein